MVATRWPCIQIVNSIELYYVVDPFWMSVRGDRVGLGDASTRSTLLRVHGSQVLWTHRGGRAASQLASFNSLDTDNDACINCHRLPAAYGEDQLRVPRRRSAQLDRRLSR